jgi:hypothetical protein
MGLVAATTGSGAGATDGLDEDDDEPEINLAVSHCVCFGVEPSEDTNPRPPDTEFQFAALVLCFDAFDLMTRIRAEGVLGPAGANPRVGVTTPGLLAEFAYEDSFTKIGSSEFAL